jgi:hypothetical protein
MHHERRSGMQGFLEFAVTPTTEGKALPVRR